MGKMTAKKNNLREWLWQNSTWVLALLFAIVNIWLTTKLSPLAQDIATLKVKVDVVEAKIKTTDDALIRIEEKLDQLILRQCQ